MVQLEEFRLPRWLEGNSPSAELVLGGSAAPALTLNDLIDLSNDPAKTKEAFQFLSTKLQAYNSQGSLFVRETIAELYSKEVHPEHIVTATGTTGSNLTVFHSLVQAGDHVICQYPTYPQLIGLPKSLQCELSFWKLDPANAWRPDLGELRKLIKPSTKVLVLNNPGNPTGSHFDSHMQREILDIARQHDIIVFVDEIFRPLYHGKGEAPVTSFVEHDYAKVVVTSSMSKAWGMPGVRNGWIICRDRAILDLLLNAREYTLQATSVIDELIAAEALSTRCRHAILDRHLGNAQRGLELLDSFVKKNADVCSWSRPTAGATAFLKFTEPDRKSLDDVAICRELLEKHSVLMTPGSLGFADDEGQSDFRGYVRIQFTLAPEYLGKALEQLQLLLDQRRKQSKL